MKQVFAVKGHICWSRNQREMTILENGMVICEDGICRGAYPVMPEQYAGIPVLDYGDRLVIPGLTDLHVHAPQYAYRGTGMDLELLEWLEQQAFPEESRYAELSYAEQAYGAFTKDLKESATTRACVFASRHVEATLLLMKQLEKAGLIAYVGKVNMDRNCPDPLREKDAASAAADTREWILEALSSGNGRVRPILTPRFIPSCSEELLERLGELRGEFGLPVQSHLSENLNEIQWVKELCPQTDFYGQAYDRFGLFGDGPTVMAHCVYSTPEEIRLMKEKRVFVAHCPQSNMNVASGIAPVRQYLEEGLCMGLGSDVAGGASLSIFRAMTDAIQCSKLRWRILDGAWKPLTFPEAFYLATKGGGAFFGKAGSFEEGYEMDAVVLDDSCWSHPQPLPVPERLERLAYLGDERAVTGKYIQGLPIFERGAILRQ